MSIQMYIVCLQWGVCSSYFCLERGLNRVWKAVGSRAPGSTALPFLIVCHHPTRAQHTFRIQIAIRMINSNISRWHFKGNEYTLTLSTLGTNSADAILKYFFLFFHENRFWILYKLSPMEKICMKYQLLFSGKIRKISLICRLRNFPIMC